VSALRFEGEQLAGQALTVHLVAAIGNGLTQALDACGVDFGLFAQLICCSC
jgi:hypothetical protein